MKLLKRKMCKVRQHFGESSINFIQVLSTILHLVLSNSFRNVDTGVELDYILASL